MNRLKFNYSWHFSLSFAPAKLRPLFSDLIKFLKILVKIRCVKCRCKETCQKNINNSSPLFFTSQA